MSEILPYGRQWIDELDVRAVTEQLSSPWLTQGPKVAEFEEALAVATGARHAVAVASGTAALHLAAIVAGVGPGKTGVTSANTFVASANCIAYAGGRPAFADVDPATGLIDVDDLERRCQALSDEGVPPTVIIPVDFAGQPANLAAIRQVARKFGARVIEDAAHSLGATYQSDGETIRCGSCSDTDLAILSFHPVKHVTTGEGGAVLTNDSAIHRRLMELRTHGMVKDPARLTRNDGPWYHEQQELGYHYRLTDLQCALGVSQMRRLGFFLEQRRALAARYEAALARAPFAGRVAPLAVARGVEHAYHLYVVRLLPRANETVADVATHRKVLFTKLAAAGIQAQVHYIPVPRQPWYRTNFATRPEDFPGAEAYYAGCLSLPLFPKMRDADVDRVVGVLGSWVEAA
ncbi:MAG TPA: UDP-4-amino-4,6-dideoxy-N-acetyl-beta-L-altrosamine transaminase [Rhodothermales bacterium]|nr:UDP-4-amino-4,6-dideoxy-N-acetyl-beta-L-altrosamine transaminase [Rhodothermales bacterium]